MTIRDLAGDGDHYSATVISEVFRGKSRVQQHQIVYAALKGEMGGVLHALALQPLRRKNSAQSAGRGAACPTTPRSTGSGRVCCAARARTAHHRVTFVELFFDLVFVFAVTQVSHNLLAHFTPLGVYETVLLLFAVWWVWIFTSWVTNWLDPDTLPVRITSVCADDRGARDVDLAAEGVRDRAVSPSPGPMSSCRSAAPPSCCGRSGNGTRC